MSDTFIPWWLVLLLGMWAIALTVWQYPQMHREVRLWSGLLTLVYLGLIFLALGVSPGANTNHLTRSADFQLSNVGFSICVTISMSASVWFVGQASPFSRRLSYVVFTLANSGAAALMQAPEVAIGLVIIAIIASKPLVRTLQLSISGKTFQSSLLDLTRFTEAPVPKEKTGEIWLIGGFCGIMAITLLGTITYALRSETTRINSSPRYTTLPVRADLERLHSITQDTSGKTSLVNLVSGPRADIMVLLAVIVFLSLAMTMGRGGEMGSTGEGEYGRGKVHGILFTPPLALSLTPPLPHSPSPASEIASGHKPSESPT